jgi:hypothetical protein
MLGFLGVLFCYEVFGELMQNTLIHFPHTKLVLYFTRDISDEGKKYGPRDFTVWNLTHILYYALGSYLFPQKRLLLWVLGLIWEISEHATETMNPLDILYNTIGIFLGSLIKG